MLIAMNIGNLTEKQSRMENCKRIVKDLAYHTLQQKFFLYNLGMSPIFTND